MNGLFLSLSPLTPGLNDMNHLQFCQHPVKLSACLNAAVNRATSQEDQGEIKNEKQLISTTTQ